MKNVWVGLWVGTMAETVLISTIRMIHWRDVFTGQQWFYGWRFVLQTVGRGTVVAAIFASTYVLVVKGTIREKKDEAHAALAA